MIKLPIEIGDTILAGKFRNRRVEVKTIETDEWGHPTVNGKPILKVRIEKLMKKEGMARFEALLNTPALVGGLSSDISTLVFPANGMLPVKHASFNRVSHNAALTAAVRSSAATGEPMYVYATRSGFNVGDIEPKLPTGEQFQEINAKYDFASKKYTATKKVRKA